MMRRSREYFILVDSEPVAVDYTTWVIWMGAAGRRVALTETDLFRVSTVFLGLDHRFGKGPPLIFETMVFVNDDSWEDEETIRYSTYDDALTGHQAIVRRIQRNEALALAQVKERTT